MSKIPETRTSVEYQFTPVPNEILDELCRTRVPGEDRQILDAISRVTYGWGRRDADMTLSQFSSMTGQYKSHVVRAIKRLSIRRLIIVTESGNGKSKKYRINNNIPEWKSLPNLVTSGISQNDDAALPNPAIKVAESGNESLPNLVIPVTESGNDNGGKATADMTLPIPKERIKEKYKEKKESGEAPPGLLKGQGASLNGKKLRFEPIIINDTLPIDIEERKRILREQATALREQEAREAKGNQDAEQTI
ncbi:MAG: replication protein [Deltaproteobacteria bacterium]|nr:replication protein [Deltaproteobacteria bacterium]